MIPAVLAGCRLRHRQAPPCVANRLLCDVEVHRVEDHRHVLPGAIGVDVHDQRRHRFDVADAKAIERQRIGEHLPVKRLRLAGLPVDHNRRAAVTRHRDQIDHARHFVVTRRRHAPVGQQFHHARRAARMVVDDRQFYRQLVRLVAQPRRLQPRQERRRQIIGDAAVTDERFDRRVRGLAG